MWVTSSRADCDYSKWLGPDYQKTYDGAGIYIQNHINPMDVMAAWKAMGGKVGFIGKKEVLKIPLLKYIIPALKFMLVGRD